MSFKNLALQWKVISLLALLAAVSFGVIVYAGTQIDAVNSINGDIIEGPAAATAALARCNRDLRQAEAGLMASVIAGSPDEVNAAATTVQTAMASYQEQNGIAAKAFPAGASEIAGILQKANNAVNVVCKQAVDKVQAGAPAAKTMQAACLPEIDATVDASSAVNAKVVAEEKRLDLAADVVAYHSELISGAVMVVMSLLTIGLAILLTRHFIVGPVRDSLGVMERLGHGELTADVPHAERRDEVGAIANALLKLRADLREAAAVREEHQKAQAAASDTMKRRNDVGVRFVAEMQDMATVFAQTSDEVAESARGLSGTAEETSRQAQAVAAAAEEAATNVQTVAAASEEMAVSVREISTQVTHSATIADNAYREAQASNERIATLATAASAIGDVVNLIRGIADQTSRATQEIEVKVSEIQTATDGTVSSMSEIIKTISGIKDASAAIASAIEEQGATTDEIARNCQQAAAGTTQVTQNISGVGQAAEMTGAASTQLMAMSSGLSEKAANLKSSVATFVKDLAAV